MRRNRNTRVVVAALSSARAASQILRDAASGLGQAEPRHHHTRTRLGTRNQQRIGGGDVPAGSLPSAPPKCEDSPRRGRHQSISLAALTGETE